MNTVNTSTLTAEQLEDAMLSMMNLEERIKYRQRQFAERVAARAEADRLAAELFQEEQRQKKLAQKQRQASNKSARAAENQRIRDLRNSGRK